MLKKIVEAEETDDAEKLKVSPFFLLPVHTITSNTTVRQIGHTRPSRHRPLHVPYADSEESGIIPAFAVPFLLFALVTAPVPPLRHHLFAQALTYKTVVPHLTSIDSAMQMKAYKIIGKICQSHEAFVVEVQHR